MIDLLRNADVLLFCCEVSQEFIESRWVQLQPTKLNRILGSRQIVKIPKQAGSPEYLISIPDDLGAVHTDVRFPLISMASE